MWNGSFGEGLHCGKPSTTAVAGARAPGCRPHGRDALVSTTMVFRRISRLFSSGGRRQGSGSSGLGIEEIEKVGTPEDPLHGYDEALERNLAAMEAEQRGEVDRAIALYEQSVAEEFVDSHPYERLAGLYGQRRTYGETIRVLEAYLQLARSGRLPRGAQRSADRRLEEIEARAARYRALLGENG